MKMHMNTHIGEKEMCGLCGQWLRCVADHMRTVHKTGKQKPCTEVTLSLFESCLKTAKKYLTHFSAARFSSIHTTEESIPKGSMKGKSKFQSHFAENYFELFACSRSICPVCGNTFTKLKDHMKAVHNITNMDMTSLKTVNTVNIDEN